MDVYEMFAEKHCQGRQTRIKLCEELKERVKDLITARQEAAEAGTPCIFN